MITTDIHILLVGVFLKAVSSTVVIPNVTPTNCESRQYFQYSSLRCVACGPNQKKSSDSLSCDCANGFRISSDYGGPEKTCSSCPDNEVVTKDGWNCIKCQRNEDYDAATRTCLACGAGAVSVERRENGQILSQKLCVTCSQLTSPGGEERVCNQCHPQVLKATGSKSCSCSGKL